MRPLVGLLAALLLTGAALVAPVARVAACSCREMTPQQAFDNADVVFVGTAVAAVAPIGDDPFDPLLVRFVVEEVRKDAGSLDRELVVETQRDSAICGASFEVGTRYVVYANLKDGGLSSSLCSGNEVLGAGLSPDSAGGVTDVSQGLPLPALLAGLGLLVVVAGGGYLFLRR
jgi:hypothetical protein